MLLSVTVSVLGLDRARHVLQAAVMAFGGAFVLLLPVDPTGASLESVHAHDDESNAQELATINENPQ